MSGGVGIQTNSDSKAPGPTQSGIMQVVLN